MDYIAYLHKDKKSDFGVSFPDFPGCVTAGRSLDEARRRAPEALAFHIASMIEDGEKIPKPSNIDDLVGDEFSETDGRGMVFLVSYATS
jgi:predicted RNase H-like HicB family nuclease